MLPWYELEPPIGVGTVEAVGAVGTVGRTPTVGTVGLSDLWETVGDSGRAWYGGVTVGITVGHRRTLSDCRTVGLSDCRITVGSLSDFTVGLSDRGSSDESLRAHCSIASSHAPRANDAARRSITAIDTTIRCGNQMRRRSDAGRRSDAAARSGVRGRSVRE